MIKQENKKGFSIIELIVVIFIVGIIASASAPLYRNVQQNKKLNNTNQIVLQSLRRAQILAQSSEGDSAWGTQVSGGNVTIFKGSSFASRSISYDEITAIPVDVIISGATEFIFAKQSGYPITPSSLSLTLDNQTKTIIINAKGNISN
jgi:prepilin-type N-terminal cleavage/methylation domain-containing protein